MESLDHPLSIKKEQTEIRPLYNDRVFRMAISFPVAAYMTLYREQEHFFESLLDLSFWFSLLFSYLVSLLLLWTINRLSFKLDETYPWRRKTVSRITAQFGLGIATPVILTFFLVALYFQAFFSVSIVETEYLNYDFPLVILLIVLGNLYYMAYYLWLVPPQGYLNEAMVMDYLRQMETVKNGEGHSVKELFLAQTSNGVVAVPQEAIAAIFRQDDYILLRTFDRQTITLIQSVTEAFKDLNDQEFFKINPRYIVNYRLCKKFKPGQYGKREVDLGPPLNITEEVSRSKATEFEEWMGR